MQRKSRGRNNFMQGDEREGRKRQSTEKNKKCIVCKSLLHESVCQCDVHGLCLLEVISTLMRSNDSKLKVTHVGTQKALYDYPCPACKNIIRIDTGEQLKDSGCKIHPLMWLLTVLGVGLVGAVCGLGIKLTSSLEYLVSDNKKNGYNAAIVCFTAFLIIFLFSTCLRSRQREICQRSVKMYAIKKQKIQHLNHPEPISPIEHKNKISNQHLYTHRAKLPVLGLSAPQRHSLRENGDDMVLQLNSLVEEKSNESKDNTTGPNSAKVVSQPLQP